MPDRLELTHRGRTAVIEKRVVHQWRTDIVLHVDGRQYTIGRLEGGMTIGEVKRMAAAWLDSQRARNG